LSSPLAYFWRHPRRTGFIAFNLVALVAFVAWGAFTADMSNEGIAGVPNLMLGYTGMMLLGIAWVVAWLAWGWLVASRQLRRRNG
jgi:hypothetical protein